MVSKYLGYHKLEGTVDKIYEDFVHLNLSTLKYRILQKRVTVKWRNPLKYCFSF